jgi:hypothetical protein
MDMLQGMISSFMIFCYPLVFDNWHDFLVFITI